MIEQLQSPHTQYFIQMLMIPTRGAKVAMALALQSPKLVANLVAVDNAPVDAVLGRDFAGYVRAMKKIEEASVTRQSEADQILAEIEPVLPPRRSSSIGLTCVPPDSPYTAISPRKPSPATR